MMTTMTLKSFLEARIAEDETAARQIHAGRCDTPAEVTMDTMGRPMDPVCDCDWHISRVLAECEAKRLVVWLSAAAESRTHDDDPMPEGSEWLLGRRQGASAAVFALASVYADHPDYLPEWKHPDYLQEGKP